MTKLEAWLEHEKSYSFEWDQNMRTAIAVIEKLKEALGMVDHVGMHEPYDRIVREALAIDPEKL